MKPVLNRIRVNFSNAHNFANQRKVRNPSRSRTIGDYPVSGKVLDVQVCSSCHGLDGHSSSPIIPNLAGQQKEYLINQLNDYRDRTRRNKYSVMYMWD